MHFPASSFHDGKDLEINGLGCRDEEIIGGATEKNRGTSNGASVKTRIGAIGFSAQTMIRMHQNLFNEFLPFARSINTALNQLEHFQGKHVGGLLLDMFP
jgi:hypothetical protein